MAEHKIISTLMRPFFNKGKTASFTVPGALTDRSRILCIDCGDLSDFLFHVPLLTAIRHHFPGSKMDFLARAEITGPMTIDSSATAGSNGLAVSTSREASTKARVTRWETFLPTHTIADEAIQRWPAQP